MILLSRFLAVLALILIGFAPAQAECRTESFERADYTICRFDVATDDLRLFWKDAAGVLYKTFDALAGALKGEGLTLAFAINGGMYGEDFVPTGLYMENGRTLVEANTVTVPGSGAQVPNFYKKPNGVFFIGGGKAGVMETEAFGKAKPKAAFATQSGPMLLIDGKIHPAFIENSSDLKPRDGVGVSGSTVIFAISEGRVSFYDFARLFRDALGVKNALFLDGGSAPGLYAPELGRNDRPGHGGYGPIVGVVK